jgi:cytochrome c biogenesis protein
MRIALFLLMLLAIAAMPGSWIPQRSVDARAVEAFALHHPQLAPWLDRIGAFHVYSSPWFSAIYLLLMVSLVGCIVPRSGAYLRALRARPPKAPRNFQRMPASGSFTTDRTPAEVLAAARIAVGRARVDVVDDELRAERGYLREFGNLVFHVSVIVVLVGVAVGSLFGYRGAAIVTEGDAFANALTQYDEFASGALFKADQLRAFSLDVANVTARFQLTGPQRGAPREFALDGVATGADGKRSDVRITVNHPLSIGSAKVYLIGQGYAPVIKVTQPDGVVAFDDPVPFLPADGTYTSSGVVKVADASPVPLGLEGFFLPTAVRTGTKAPSISVFPAAANPYLALQVWTGDLYSDTGPQSVYALDKRKLAQMKDKAGKPFRIELTPGQETVLPNGTRVEFVAVRQFARLQIGSTPLVQLPLWGIVAGLVGLSLSLFVRPRRIWVRTRRDAGVTVVEVAALDRVPRDDLPGDVVGLITDIQTALGSTDVGSTDLGPTGAGSTDLEEES